MARLEAQATANFLIQLFESPDPKGKGRGVTVVDVLDRAVRKLEKDRSMRPDHRAQLSYTLGCTYEALGLTLEAISLLDKARNYYSVNGGEDHPNALSAIRRLARCYGHVGRSADALLLRQRYWESLQRTKGPLHSDTLTAMDDLAVAHCLYGSGERSLEPRVGALLADGFAAQPSDLDSGWAGEAFGKGKAAMSMEGNWIVPFLKDQYPDIKYGVAELPAGSAGKATMAFTVCYGVPANGKNNDKALKVVDYLTGAEGMKAWTDLGLAMPTRASLAEGWLAQYPDLKPFIAGAEYAHKWQFRPGFQDVLDAFNAGLQDAFAGNQTADTVLSSVQDVGNQVLSK